MRWEKLKNGELLRIAAATGFDAFLSIDKNLRHEHNLAFLPLPVIVLDCPSNALPALAPLGSHLVLLLQQLPKTGLHVLKLDGTVESVQNRASS
jgi:phytoene dehydrogenase-like protein